MKVFLVIIVAVAAISLLYWLILAGKIENEKNRKENENYYT